MTNMMSAVSPESFHNFGNLLRYRRKRAELSQRKLALYVGYHHSYMSRIESNEHIPDPAMLMARFVPAWVLEKDPVWTYRLLELAAADKEDHNASTESEPVSVKPVTDSDASDLESPPSLFPVSFTPLLGRKNEINAFVGFLSGGDVCLITLIGPPGVGKTCLAVQTANEAAGIFARGLKFIDLAPFSDPNGFLPTLALHLEVSETHPKHGTAEMQLYDEHQVNCLLKTAQDIKDKLYTLYYLAIHTGMREAELPGLK